VKLPNIEGGWNYTEILNFHQILLGEQDVPEQYATDTITVSEVVVKCSILIEN
jgi:hypothetical protein